MADGRKPAVLTGLAVGDALGMPFEHFSDAVDPRLHTWGGEYVEGSWPGRLTETLEERVPMPGLPAGCWTDDTGMALALSQSLVSVGRYDADTVSRAYVLWAVNTPHGMGGSTRTALRAIRDGVTWERSGVIFPTPEAVGNGTAMRIAPLGVFYRSDLRALSHLAALDASITHAHEEAVAASFIISTMTAVLTLADPRDVTITHVVEDLLDSVESRLAGTQVIRSLAVALRYHTEGAPPTAVFDRIGRRGNAAQTVATAVYCALHHHDDFGAGVRAAIRGGGDADTRGAITGALLGARLGLDAIPQSLLDGLKLAPMLVQMDRLLAEGFRT